MTAPRRIQRRRTRGWRMPEGVVYVGRPTRWGNPYRPGDEATATILAVINVDPVNRAAGSHPSGETSLITVDDAVELYRQHLRHHPDIVAAARAELAGKDLACWCREGDPCHADVLLEVANGAEP